MKGNWYVEIKSQFAYDGDDKFIKSLESFVNTGFLLVALRWSKKDRIFRRKKNHVLPKRTVIQIWKTTETFCL